MPWRRGRAARRGRAGPSRHGLPGGRRRDKSGAGGRAPRLCRSDERVRAAAGGGQRAAPPRGAEGSAGAGRGAAGPGRRKRRWRGRGPAVPAEGLPGGATPGRAGPRERGGASPGPGGRPALAVAPGAAV